jgi:hypothetical protein
VRHLALCTLLIAAATPGVADEAVNTLPVVDIAALETLAPGSEPAPETTNPKLHDPLRRIAEELERALERQRAPQWRAPEAHGDWVAATR